MSEYRLKKQIQAASSVQKKDKMADGSGFPSPLPCADANHLASVVHKVCSAIDWINQYLGDNVISFRNTYPLDSDLSGE